MKSKKTTIWPVEDLDLIAEHAEIISGAHPDGLAIKRGPPIARRILLNAFPFVLTAAIFGPPQLMNLVLIFVAVRTVTAAASLLVALCMMVDTDVDATAWILVKYPWVSWLAFLADVSWIASMAWIGGWWIVAAMIVAACEIVHLITVQIFRVAVARKIVKTITAKAGGDV